MIDTPAVAEAKLRAKTARDRLNSALSDVRQRLSPAAVAQKTWSAAVDQGAEVVDLAVEHGTKGLAVAIDKAARARHVTTDFYRRKPDVVTAGAIVAAALLVGPSILRRFSRPEITRSPVDAPPRLHGPIPYLEIRP